MPPHSHIVPHDALPAAAFDLMKAGFPYETHEIYRRFWDASPDSFHALVYDGDALVAHAGCIDRRLYVAGQPVDAAYVEYVCAEPRRSGYGSIAMRALAAEIERRGYPLAALATGVPAFYERLGWRVWRGPTAYRKDGAAFPTPEETVMVFDLGAAVNLDAPLECDWRPVGDIW
jgi:GNAT superfamily N-acetyltransferase